MFVLLALLVAAIACGQPPPNEGEQAGGETTGGETTAEGTTAEETTAETTQQEAPTPGEGTLVVYSGRSEEPVRSEEHTAELQSRQHLACRLLLEKKT